MKAKAEPRVGRSEEGGRDTPGRRPKALSKRGRDWLFATLVVH